MKKGWGKYLGLLLLGAFFYPAIALAITANQLPPMDFVQSGDIPTILANLISWMLWIAGVLAVIYLVYAGVTYITSAGNAEKAQAGKNGVMYAVIGIVVVALSLVIVTWVTDIIKGEQPPQEQQQPATTMPSTTAPQ